MRFIDELFSKYQVRKSRKQKKIFTEWVTEYAKDNGWNTTIESGSIGTKNIVFGNVDDAEIIFTAHYDTCARMIVPNFITPKNIFIYLIYQVVLCFILLLPWLVLSFVGNIYFADYAVLFGNIGYIITLVLLILMMVGPANPNTANDNTSGVATVLGLLSEFDSSKDKVAFVLFDFEELGLIGSSSFKSKHKVIIKEKILVNFDCVSDGNKMMFVLNKNTKELASAFEESFVNTKKITVEVCTNGVFYPSDQACFKKGIGVCALKTNKFLKSGYMDRIHTIKDTVFEKENIEFLVDGSYKLYNNIQNKK